MTAPASAAMPWLARQAETVVSLATAKEDYNAKQYRRRVYGHQGRS